MQLHKVKGPFVRAFRLHYTAKDLMLLHKKAIYLCKIQIYYNRFSMKKMPQWVQI